MLYLAGGATVMATCALVAQGLKVNDEVLCLNRIAYAKVDCDD
jgi:hypothetical protein